ncbi:MAG: 30S ribosomal protein S9 [Candidatus Dojkabacteria bacterium]|nr:30S ribosomal protein S9 [Candidatus Dojkabacteria bacterium]
MAISSKRKYFEGIGSRKRAKARVRVYEGSETSVVNGIPFDEYFGDKPLVMRQAKRPLVACGVVDKVFFSAHVSGGGISGQGDAIRLGLANALVRYDEAFRPVLSKEDLLTRDPREVERKKYFLKKARKRPQYSKR